LTARLVCLDASVVVKYLVPEEQSDAAIVIVRDALAAGDVLVAPAWSWAEVGSALRAKVRRSLLTLAEAGRAWKLYESLPIAFFDSGELRARAWDIAATLELATLYDAAYLACIETAPGFTDREFWTADREFLVALGNRRPPYVRELGSS